MLNIQLSPSDANTLRYLMHEILDIDRRARCSDSYFRAHFMDIAKSGLSSGFYKRLTDELDRAAKAQEEALFAPPQAELEESAASAEVRPARKRRKAES